jgi:hypothetical protein
VTRLGLDSQPAAVTTVPHADWTGGYVNGTLLNGTAQSTCTGTSGCLVVLWQGGRNLYAFEGGDPINFRDPFGLFGVAGAVGSIVLGVKAKDVIHRSAGQREAGGRPLRARCGRSKL